MYLEDGVEAGGEVLLRWMRAVSEEAIDSGHQLGHLVPTDPSVPVEVVQSEHPAQSLLCRPPAECRQPARHVLQQPTDK